MNAGILIPIVLSGCIFGVAVVAIVANASAQVVCHWRDASLKSQMVDAGYSATEIERVFGARHGETNGAEFDKPPVRKTPPVQKMAL